MTYIPYLISLTVSGHHEEALSMVRRAQELDPISSYSNAYTSLALVYAGHIDKAIEELKLILITDPHYYLAHFHLAWAYLSKSMYKEMCAESKIAVDLSKGNPFAIACLFLAYYQTNKRDLSDKLFEGLKKRSENEYIVSTSFYLMHRVRGEEELALEWLKRACIERDIYLPWCWANPFLIPKGSKYMALVKEMGLDY
jgi:tetratricopeptide (TPR) repeat protein